MAEAFGAILSFLGAVLSKIYDLIPSYGIAIILLTVLVRVVLIPLTVKQIRSMTAMQRLQPELKKLQTKYKGDRQKMNEELMKLYREHGVNPLGGCFPLLMQAPVFIALYSVLRAAVPFDVALPQSVPVEFSYTKTTVCSPEGTPDVTGEGFDVIICREGSKTQEFSVKEVNERKKALKQATVPQFVTRCGPQLDTSKSPDEVVSFVCQTPVGTGHLPKDGKLFKAIVRDKATFLGMHLACSPTDASSKTTFQLCTAGGSTKGAGSAVAVYYVLVVLMMGTTYYQQRQIAGQATGPQAAQMQMMGRIMPIFLGFISLRIPAGVVIYWIVSNVWTIGQQQYFLKNQPQGGPAPSSGDKGKPAKPSAGPKGGDKPKPGGPKR